MSMGVEGQHARDYQKAVGCYGDLSLEELLRQIEVTEEMASKFAVVLPEAMGPVTVIG